MFKVFLKSVSIIKYLVFFLFLQIDGDTCKISSKVNERGRAEQTKHGRLKQYRTAHFKLSNDIVLIYNMSSFFTKLSRNCIDFFHI